MTNQSGSIKSLLQKAHDYMETRVDLVRLKTVDKSSELLSSAASIIAIALAVLLFVGMISIGLALYIGHLLGRLYYGFFIMGGVYILVTLVIYACRRSLIKTPLYNNIVKKILN